MILRVVLLMMSAVLLAAHFLRQGNFMLMILWLLAPLLLLIKKRWSLFTLQLLTYLGVVIWLNTTVQMVQQRLMWGQDWGRLAIIMGGVVLFTLATGLLLNSAVVKEKYPE